MADRDADYAELTDSDWKPLPIAICDKGGEYLPPGTLFAQGRRGTAFFKRANGTVIFVDPPHHLTWLKSN